MILLLLLLLLIIVIMIILLLPHHYQLWCLTKLIKTLLLLLLLLLLLPLPLLLLLLLLLILLLLLLLLLVLLLLLHFFKKRKKMKVPADPTISHSSYTRCLCATWLFTYGSYFILLFYYAPEKNFSEAYCFQSHLWFFFFFFGCYHDNSWKAQPIRTKFSHMTFDWKCSAVYKNGHRRSHVTPFNRGLLHPHEN